MEFKERKSIKISGHAYDLLDGLKEITIERARKEGNVELTDALTCMGKGDLVNYIILGWCVMENINHINSKEGNNTGG